MIYFAGEIKPNKISMPQADISNRTELTILLNKLTADSKALWGKMNAQNMIEHLANTVKLTNGKKQAVLKATESEARSAKEQFIYTDIEMSKGLKSSTMGDNPEPLEFENLQDAIKNLNEQLNDFEHYFKNNPDAYFIHPRLGFLNHKEWIVLHDKHFTHHFKQFGLIS